MADIVAFNPPAPGAINIRTFQDLRRFLITYVVNQWMQYVNGYLGNGLVPILNQHSGYGTDIPAAASITPSAGVQAITGTATISTINPMPTAAGKWGGPIYLIARAGYSTSTAGNIYQAVTVAAGHMGIFAFDRNAGKWSVVTS